MNCRGKPDTLQYTVHELFCAVSRFPHYISCYIAESRFYLWDSVVWAWFGWDFTKSLASFICKIKLWFCSTLHKSFGFVQRYKRKAWLCSALHKKALALFSSAMHGSLPLRISLTQYIHWPLIPPLISPPPINQSKIIE